MDSIHKQIIESLKKQLYDLDSSIKNMNITSYRKVYKIIEPRVIVDIIKSRYNINIKKRSRKQEYIDARILASYFLYKYTLLSLKRIGSYVGVEDHSTVLYHVKKVRSLIDVYKSYEDNVKSIDAEILNYYQNIYNGNSIQALQRD
jgi:chromosomal replication initiation ATPase DnaA